ncbi:MAG: hypothetical protein JWR03_1883 [Cohnella sp.]|nr:hypothetical protein [Cohnella sp.]
MLQESQELSDQIRMGSNAKKRNNAEDGVFKLIFGVRALE